MASDSEARGLLDSNGQLRPRKRTISTRSLNDAVSSLERFHRRTISTSDMRGSRPGYAQIGDEEESLDITTKHELNEL